MVSRRLEQQYLRLLGVVGVQQVTITLQELADKLSCTKRHMRTLLVKMQQAGGFYGSQKLAVVAVHIYNYCGTLINY